MKDPIQIKAEDNDLISSVRIEEGPRHDRVTVFVNGQNSGTLVVDHGHGTIMASIILRGSKRGERW